MCTFQNEALERGMINFVSYSGASFPLGTCMPVFGEGGNVEEKEGNKKTKKLGSHERSNY